MHCSHLYFSLVPLPQDWGWKAAANGLFVCAVEIY